MCVNLPQYPDGVESACAPKLNLMCFGSRRVTMRASSTSHDGSGLGHALERCQIARIQRARLRSCRGFHRETTPGVRIRPFTRAAGK